MSLTVHRLARVDARRRIALRHAGFRPGTLVDVVAVAPRARAGKARAVAYSLFDLWSFAAVGVVLLGFGIFALHRQIERRIDQIGRL